MLYGPTLYTYNAFEKHYQLKPPQSVTSTVFHHPHRSSFTPKHSSNQHIDIVVQGESETWFVFSIPDFWQPDVWPDEMGRASVRGVVDVWRSQRDPVHLSSALPHWVAAGPPPSPFLFHPRQEVHTRAISDFHCEFSFRRLGGKWYWLTFPQKLQTWYISFPKVNNRVLGYL